jgi:hypothetical protein
MKQIAQLKDELRRVFALTEGKSVVEDFSGFKRMTVEALETLNEEQKEIRQDMKDLTDKMGNFIGKLN